VVLALLDVKLFITGGATGWFTGIVKDRVTVSALLVATIVKVVVLSGATDSIPAESTVPISGSMNIEVALLTAHTISDFSPLDMDGGLELNINT